MKSEHFATTLLAIAALGATLGAVPSAAAHENDRSYDRRGRVEITVRTQHGRTFSVDRGDRLFYRLTDRPYSFRPGLTYSYTDNCNRRGCAVLVFAEHRRRPVDRIFAPPLPFERGRRDERGGRDRDGWDRDDHGRDRDHDWR